MFFALFGIMVSVYFTALISNSKMTTRIQEANNDIQVYVIQGNGFTSVGAPFDMWKRALIVT